MIDISVFFASLAVGVILDFLLETALGLVDIRRALAIVGAWLLAAGVIGYAVVHWPPPIVALAAVSAPGIGRLFGVGMSRLLQRRVVMRASRRYLNG